MPDRQSGNKPDLTALLGSRICHDLISPLGAIGNGVELLSMSGTAGPEIALISESVTNANARIRFFRVAFGAAAADQRIGRPEVLSILSDMTRGGRLVIDWQAAGDQPRRAVKLVFLAIQCLETAMPYGGQIAVTTDGEGWSVTGTAGKLKTEPEIWAALSGPDSWPEISPAQVHFALMPEELAAQHRQLTLDIKDTQIAIGF